MSSFVAVSNDLEAFGACFKVFITLTDTDSEALTAANTEAPQPVEVTAMIDTGADITAIHPEIAEALRLEPVGEQEIVSASGERSICAKYAVKVIFPNGGIWEGSVIATDLSDFHATCLIGRDMLRVAVLTYIGKANVFTLSF